MSNDMLEAELLLECIFGAGALAVGCYCVLQHALTLVYRPSTTLSSWNTVALGHGLAASFCLLLAAPLLGLLLDGAKVRLGELILEITGWLPAAIILASVLLLYTVCGALRSVLTCGAGAATWPETIALDTEDYEVLRHYVAGQCDTLAHKYSFGMALSKAWRVHSPAAEAAWARAQAERAQASRESLVVQLFHGTSEDSARAVVAGGFRLPSSAGMFGRGLYFADCPLKSLQYASLPLGLGACCGERYMLVCSVELGHTKLRTSAKNELDPEIDLKPSRLKRALLGLASLLAFRESVRSRILSWETNRYDSVSARPSSAALRAPEFIVYRPEQVLPLYVLAVQQVAKGSEEALTTLPSAAAQLSALAAHVSAKKRTPAAVDRSTKPPRLFERTCSSWFSSVSLV